MSRPRYLPLIVALLAIAGALSACAEGEPAIQPMRERFLIGVAQSNSTSPWRVAMNAQIAAAARRHPELEVQFADADRSNAAQVADVERFIQAGVDLLIISPNEATPLTNAVARAYDHGIPVIVLDRKVNGDKYTMWIGADNRLIGRRAGALAARWCAAEGRDPCHVIELRGLEGATTTGERGDGFREGLAANPAARIVASQNANWVVDQAQPLTAAMLRANPVVDVVFAHNDLMAEGALRAFAELGRDPETTLVIGIDGLPTPGGGLQSVIDGRIDVTYIYPTGGAEAIAWAVRILERGTSPPKLVVLDATEVLPANAPELLRGHTGE